MANIFGVDIETPQEQQQRMLLEALKAGEQFRNNATAQFGYNLAMALSATFGGAKKAREAKEAQFEAISEGVREGDLDFIGQDQKFNRITTENADKVRHAAVQAGASEAEANQLRSTYLQQAGQYKQAVREGITLQAIQQEKMKKVNEGADPIEAELLGTMHVIDRLWKLPGAENAALATQLASNFAKRKQEYDLNKAKIAKLKAEGGGEAGESSSPLEKLQMDRMQMQGVMSQIRASNPGMTEEQLLNMPTYREAKKRYEELDMRIAKDVGQPAGSVSAAYTKRFVDTRKVTKETLAASDAVVDMFQGKDPDKAVKAVEVLASVTSLVQGTTAWTSAFESGLGVDGGVLSAAFEEAMPKIEKKLIDLAGPGLSKREAVRLLQEVQSSVNREARAFGGPITESDRAAARLSSGIASGRVDLLFDRQVRLREQEVDNLIVEAELEGTVTRDAAGNIISDNAVSKQLKKLQEEVQASRARLDRWISGIGGSLAAPSAPTDQETTDASLTYDPATGRYVTTGGT